jgi:hypothetical protein
MGLSQRCPALASMKLSRRGASGASAKCPSFSAKISANSIFVYEAARCGRATERHAVASHVAVMSAADLWTLIRDHEFCPHYRLR